MLDELFDRVVGERLERQREVIPLAAAPALAPVEQLGPGEGDHEHPGVPARLHDELDQVEEAVARPVEVLEHEDERLRSGRDLDRRPPRAEERGAVDDLLLPAPTVVASSALIAAASATSFAASHASIAARTSAGDASSPTPISRYSTARSGQ